MIKKERIKEIIADFQQRDFSEVKNREIEIPLNTNKIITLIGIRRCGKTYHLLNVIKKLLKRKIPIEKILFINFEDERLNLSIEELDILIQAYRELNPDIKISECYFFFDEIQNIPGWEKFIRRVFDTLTKNIFISGSNSKFLSSEIATTLRGRSLTIEVFPLSFKEYLQFKNIDSNFYNTKQKAIIINQFSEYLINGGFPETVNVSPNISQNILQEYFYVMLYKDLIERYKISNTNILKYYINRIIQNITKPTSVNKIYNEIKSSGYKLNKNFLYDIQEWIEAIFFSFRIEKFNFSIIKREMSEKKLYIIDNGMINALTFHFSENWGMLFENLIFIHLRQKFKKNVFFYKEKKEVDFVVFEKDVPLQLIQVCYDFGDNLTRDREIKGIIEAAEYFKLKEARIITFEKEEEIQYKDLRINVMPAYKYLLLNS